MTPNHFEQSGLGSPTIYNQQVFVVCGPSPATNSKLFAVRKFLREHFLLTTIVVLLGLFLLGNWWATMGYPGAVTLYLWRCEILTAGLSLLTINLYRTFRRWGQERALRVAVQQPKSHGINALFCTPPPLPISDVFPAQSAFEITIERWKSEVPRPLSEAHLQQSQRLDEFLAPDALVLNLEVRRAA